MAHSKKAKQMASKAAGSPAGRSARTSPPSTSTSTSNSTAPLAISTTPASAKAVLQKQGEHAMARDGVKASIQHARHNGG